MTKNLKPDRRRTTLQERTTPCACCAHPISHRHHVFSFAQNGENSHTLQLCPNCHELFHLIQSAIVGKSNYCNRVLQKYMEAKSKEDSTFKFIMSKVMEVEDLRGAFATETPKIVNAVRKALEPYVSELRDVDILGVFDMIKQGSGVTFKVGARLSEMVSDGRFVESLWVFHFNETGVLKVETLRVMRGKDALFVPSNETNIWHEPKRVRPNI